MTRARSAVGSIYRNRDYRLQWFADGLSGCGSDLELLALIWFLLAETGSPFLVGVLGAARFLGALIGPVYGIAVDRFERRRLQLAVKAFFVITAGTAWTLIELDAFSATGAIVIAAAGGIVRQLDIVVRQALMADVVTPRDLPFATGLQRTMMEVSRLVSALLAGALLVGSDISHAYLAIIILFSLGTLLIAAMRVHAPSSLERKSLWSEALEGMSFVRGERSITAVLALAFIANLTGLPMIQGMLPLVAATGYALGPHGVSILVGTVSLGALLGSVTYGLVASGAAHSPKYVVGLLLSWQVLQAAFAQLRDLTAALPVLFLLGLISSYSMIAMAVALISNTPVRLRGRVIGARAMAVSGLPLGLLLGGWLAETFGVRASLTLASLAGAILTAAVAGRLIVARPILPDPRPT